jgi:O-antigen/teichoic acid export membrane protein
MKNKLFSHFVRGEFTRDVGTLMSGTVAAQLVPILVSPLLTRLYSPGHFGTYALYFGLSAILSLLASGNYELAIVLPDEEVDAFWVAMTVILLSLTVCMLLFLCFWLLNSFISHLLGNHEIAGWLFFIPLSIFLMNVSQAFYYMGNRGQQYRSLALSKFGQMAVTVAVYILFGFTHSGVKGLILGDMAGFLFASLFLGLIYYRRHAKSWPRLSLTQIKKQAQRYRRFPQFSMQANVINMISNQAPVILMSNFFGSTVVGFLNLSQKVLASPLAVISKSVSDVFRERASRDYRLNGNCRSIYMKTLKSLVLISIIPFSILFFAAPALFSFVFGSSWRIAGEYARILSLMFFFRFTVSPLSYMFYIAEKQNFDLIWQILLLVVTISSILAGVWRGSPQFSLLCFSITYSVMYLIYLYLSYTFAKGSPHT